ncbi:MAG: amidohydrolase family protein [Gemmatales bacterium]|nr:amidohydrolase family protein [Gemmatales bacterium]MDW8387905.1 amidohydrolase family protein [Gemmatales bacterium]
MNNNSVTVKALRYDTGEPVVVTIADGCIRSVETIPDASRRPLAELWIGPAFFDVQINGALGKAFGSPNVTFEDIAEIVAECRRHGITRLCPTLITDSEANLKAALRRLSRAIAEDRGLEAALPGIHLEGPYISPLDGPRGAHPRMHVRRPDWEEFQRLQDAADGRIWLVTLAPELEGAIRLIERLTASGVVVALGHTAASGMQIRDAVAAGARLSTHLGNGCAAMLPRHENPIWEQLAEDRLWASLIADGHHLPPAVLRCLLRCKTPLRTLLTCDASVLAGLPPGRYRVWEQELEIVPEGKIVVAGTPYLAGSWVFTDHCVRLAMQLGGATLKEAVDMAAIRPRQLLGLSISWLEVGATADLILFRFDEQGLPHIVETFVAGKSYPAAEGIETARENL